MGRSKGEFLLGKCAVPLSKIMNRQLHVSPLSKPERLFYILTWSLAVGYLCYSVWIASYEYEDELDTYYMSRGWKNIGRQKDRYDFEWEFWSSYFNDEWQWLLGHIIIGQICRYFCKTRKWLKLVYIIYSILFLSTFLGVRVVLLLIGHTLTVYLCALLTKSALATFLVAVMLISTLNSDTLVQYMKEYLVEREEGENRLYYLMMFVTAMCNLRYTSFAIEMCWHKQNQVKKINKEDKKIKKGDNKEGQENFTGFEHSIATQHSNKSPGKSQSAECSPKAKFKQHENSPRRRHKRNKSSEETQDYYLKSEPMVNYVQQVKTIKFSFTDALLYVFYLPLFCTGPLLSYDQFKSQWNAPWQSWSWTKLKPVFVSCTRVLFWAIFCEVILHYMYFSSLMGDERILNQVPLWTLAGIGYCQGQFFMVKYTVMYGIPACIASLDQLETPKGPRCISSIYLYSEMWKYFDRGLYSFIKRYIYIPLGGSQKGLVRRFLASLFCFIFIFLWHGAELDLFVWTLLNFVGVTLETVGHVFINTHAYNKIENCYLGPALSQRIKAAFAIPLFSTSIIAIFTFFRGIRVGSIYYERLILNGWPVPILTVSFTLYCCIQTSIEIDRWRKNRLKQD